MKYLKGLADFSNMPYVNITKDIGAAINAFKVIWNYPVEFNNIVIHPGDFHLSKERFKVIGSLVSSTGFEDIIHQSSVCTSGSLLGVLLGSHYNRAWIVHGAFAEALERLLMYRFFWRNKNRNSN